MRCESLALALLALISTAAAASGPALTIYPDADAGGGYAIVHETREVRLQGGAEVLRIPGLPAQMDADGLLLGFPNAAAARIDWQRVLAPGAGSAAQLDARLGQKVEVRGGGQPLATGTLLRVDGDTLTLRDGAGHLELVRDWSALSLGAGEPAPRGSTLEVALGAGHAGRYRVTLTYPTRGLGWHAAYTADLAPGTDCRIDFHAAASLSNQSGRDWRDAVVTLLAGKPRLAQLQPVPMMRLAAVPMAASAATLPAPGTIGDYRSYALPQRVDLPDASSTVVPLYAPTTLACVRRYVATIEGQRGIYETPYLGPPQPGAQNSAVESQLGLTAPHALPAGTVRVYDGGARLLGAANISDTPPGTHVELTLGEAFDLRSIHEVAAFTVDKAAGHADESFHVTVRNTSDTARTVTLREFPWRWHAWTLLASSVAPAQRDAAQLDFPLRVPARGSTVLTFTLRYELTTGNH